MFPESPRGRLYWALEETAVIAGILVAWTAIAVALILVLSAVASLGHALRLEPLRFVLQFARRSSLLWPAITQLALATTGLYVLVRAGTVLIDRYREEPAG